jgi:hypothetical protein
MHNIKNRKDTTDTFQAIDRKQLESTTGGAWSWGGTSSWNTSSTSNWNQSWNWAR